MRTGENAPRLSHRANLMEALLEMTRGRMGMTAILDDEQRVTGIFTDGDLRRALQKGLDLQATLVTDAMTRNPRTISPDKLAAEAVEIMERYKVNQLLAVDERQRLLGALNMHDLFRAKVL
jgi:arabinose-5-phosphate isomerase